MQTILLRAHSRKRNLEEEKEKYPYWMGRVENETIRNVATIYDDSSVTRLTRSRMSKLTERVTASSATK